MCFHPVWLHAKTPGYHHLDTKDLYRSTYHYGVQSGGFPDCLKKKKSVQSSPLEHTYNSITITLYQGSAGC